MRNPVGWAALTAFSLAFFAFIYAPLFVIIGYSFNSNPVNMMIWEHFTFDWYTGLLGLSDRTTDVSNRAAYVESTDLMLAALRTSLTVALFTTTISTVIGTATAIALARYRFRGRGAYNGFMMMPMMMPDIVLGIGLLIFFVTLGMNLSMLTIIIGHCTFLTSYVFIIVQARLAGLDPALEEASADLGHRNGSPCARFCCRNWPPAFWAVRFWPLSSRWMTSSSPTSSRGRVTPRCPSSSSA